MAGSSIFNQEFQTSPTQGSFLPDDLDFSIVIGGSESENKETKGKNKASGITGNLSSKIKKLMQESGILGDSGKSDLEEGLADIDEANSVGDRVAKKQDEEVAEGLFALVSKLVGSESSESSKGSESSGTSKAAGGKKSKTNKAKKNKAVKDDDAVAEFFGDIEDDGEEMSPSSKRNEVFNSLPEGFQSVIASVPALKEAFGFGELDEGVVDPVADLAKSRKLGGGR